MTNLSKAANRLAQKFNNPIVVKELRQAVRSRYIVAIILLFLLASFGTLFASLFLAGSDDYYAGRNVFMILSTVLLWTGILVIPVYAGVRLINERSGNKVDLLFVTTIKPRQIVLGKTLSGVVLVLLIFSVCAPFLMFSYLLRGIDLPSMLWILGLQFVICVLAVQAALFLATVPASRVFQVLLGLVGLAGLILTACWLTVAMVQVIQFDISFGAPDEFWVALFTLAAIAVAVSILLFVCSVSLLTPAMANRTWRIRVYFTGLWLVSLAVCLGVDYWSRMEEAFLGWVAVTAVVLSIMLWAVLSEKDTWTRRMRRHVPRSKLLRIPFFLFYSTNAGGLVWNMTLMLSTLGIMMCFAVYPELLLEYRSLVEDRNEGLVLITSFWLYFLVYGLAGYYVRRLFLWRWSKPGHTFIIAGFLMGMICAIPAIVYTVLDIRQKINVRYSHSFLQLGNPMMLLANIPDFRVAHLTLTSIVAVMLFIAFVPISKGKYSNAGH